METTYETTSTKHHLLKVYVHRHSKIEHVQYYAIYHRRIYKRTHHAYTFPISDKVAYVAPLCKLSPTILPHGC